VLACRSLPINRWRLISRNRPRVTSKHEIFADGGTRNGIGSISLVATSNDLQEALSEIRETIHSSNQSLRFSHILRSSFPLPRYSFRSWPPKRRRILLIPHNPYPRGRGDRIRVLREVGLRAGLLRQQHQGGRSLRELVRPHWMSLNPVPEEIVNVLPSCRRLERAWTSMRSRDSEARIE
jgi:hypothetical protein